MGLRNSSIKELLGPRRGAIDVAVQLDAARDAVTQLSVSRASASSNVPELKKRYASFCRTYYTLAAISRRRILEARTREEALRLLFGFRSSLERAILADCLLVSEQDNLWAVATGKSFFGASAKQGVSIRYPLLTCVPTALCGGRCYGHDGRDRELHLVFRGVLNFMVGSGYEAANEAHRSVIMNMLSRAIDSAIREARGQRDRAASEGFEREARIRFSHLGEMVATPKFANDLARDIRRRAPDVACVIYTRHPNAKDLDGEVLRVNFTVEGVDDKRLQFAPGSARIVNSSWDGRVNIEADVNFLEHHVEKSVVRDGAGHVCPISENHAVLRSCDEARCDACFFEKKVSERMAWITGRRWAETKVPACGEGAASS